MNVCLLILSCYKDDLHLSFLAIVLSLRTCRVDAPHVAC